MGSGSEGQVAVLNRVVRRGHSEEGPSQQRPARGEGSVPGAWGKGVPGANSRRSKAQVRPCSFRVGARSHVVHGPCSPL